MGRLGVGTTNPQARTHIFSPSSTDGLLIVEMLPGSLNTSTATNGAIALGTDVHANNGGAIAMGYMSTANAYQATAMGFNTLATGTASTAMGAGAKAQGATSIAGGQAAIATGDGTIALGNHATAQAFNSIAVGSYNVPQGTLGSWIATDPIFVIGNGQSSNNPSNAMTVLKDGKVGIGTTAPFTPLTVQFQSTAGNYVEPMLSLFHTDSNSPGSNGIGSSIVFLLEPTTEGWNRRTAEIHAVLDDANYNSLDGSLRFLTVGPNSFGGQADEKVRITSSGAVGIGTTSPDKKLDVAGTARIGVQANRHIIFENADIFALQGAGASTLELQSLWGLPTGDTHINKYSGKVGIGLGAAAPVARLDVKGDIRLQDGGYATLICNATNEGTIKYAPQGFDIGGQSYSPGFYGCARIGGSYLWKLFHNMNPTGP